MALLALLFRLVETTLALGAISHSVVAMEAVTGIARSGRIDPAAARFVTQLHSAYAADFTLAAIFLGCGSALFNYLLYRARYVPRLLAGWGVFASVLLLLAQMLILVDPGIEDLIVPGAFAPIVLDEIALGLWLLARGVRIPDALV